MCGVQIDALETGFNAQTRSHDLTCARAMSSCTKAIVLSGAHYINFSLERILTKDYHLR
jgi:hypothetical protein